jgi:16S rRNA (cytidine1402-2'-O)-methyltransferase
VATPIGNLRDITLRALDVLRQADFVACEDTRRARKLCTAFDISVSLTPYHAHNEHQRTEALLDAVEQGKHVVALSDAGTPAISDPGFLLMRAAYQRNIEPVIIPGVSALTFAVVAAGLPVDRFTFAGFPPVKSGKRQRFLERLMAEGSTAVIFESPYRVEKLLKQVAEVCGEKTPVAVVREATKMHEQVARGPVCDLIDPLAFAAKGEFVIVLNLRE